MELIDDLLNSDLSVSDLGVKHRLKTSEVREIAAKEGIDVDKRRLDILARQSIERAHEAIGDKLNDFLADCEAMEIKNDPLIKKYGITGQYYDALLQLHLGITPKQRTALCRKNLAYSVSYVPDSMSGDGKSLEWLSRKW